MSLPFIVVLCGHTEYKKRDTETVIILLTCKKRGGAMNSFKFFSLSVVVLYLGACTAAPGQIFNKITLDEDESFTTGSRQRIVHNTIPKKSSMPGQVDPKRITCTEPSPDVAVAVANSFGVGISVFGQGAGSMSATQAEGLIQLAERTVTVQLLREQMYRACESYSNGAITGTTYSLIMGKMNDTIVTLMLGETAGGAFGRSLGAIGTKASASGGGSMMEKLAENVQEVQQATDDLAQANENVESKKETADLANANATANPADSSAQQTAESTKEELDQAEGEQNVKKENLQNKLEAMSKASAEVNKLVAAGGITHQPGPEVADVLKEMQANFLKDDFDDSYITACLIELGGTKPLNQNQAKEIVGSFGIDLSLGSNSDKKFSARDLITTYNLDLDTAEKIVASIIGNFQRLNPSGLFTHCDKHLPDYMAKAHADQVELDKYGYEIKLRNAAIAEKQAQAKGITEFNKGVATCDKLKDAAEKNRCIGAVLNISAGASVIPVSFGPQPTTPIHALGHFDKVEKSKVELGEKFEMLKIQNIADVPSSLNGNNLASAQKKREALVYEKTQLEMIVKKLIDNVNNEVNAKNRTEIVLLKVAYNETLLKIEIAEIPAKRKLERDILKTLSLKSQVWVEKIKPLKDRMGNAVKKIDELILNIQNFNNKYS